jgi:glucose-6-phosphate 1-dehydrogenase
LTAVQQSLANEMDAYERLLTDAMKGDPLLFVRQDAVDAAWVIVDGILNDVVSVHQYEPGTWGPDEAQRLAMDIGGWNNPQGKPGG